MGMGYKASDLVSDAADDSNRRCMVSLRVKTIGTGEPKLGGRDAFIFTLILFVDDDGCVVIIVALLEFAPWALFPFWGVLSPFCGVLSPFWGVLSPLFAFIIIVDGCDW